LPTLEAKLKEDPNQYGLIFLGWLWGRQEIPEAFRKRETLLEEIRHKTGLNVIWVEGDRQFRIDAAMMTPEQMRKQLDQKAEEILQSPILKNVRDRNPNNLYGFIKWFLTVDHDLKLKVFSRVWEKFRNLPDDNIVREAEKIFTLPEGQRQLHGDFEDVSVREVLVRPSGAGLEVNQLLQGMV